MKIDMPWQYFWTIEKMATLDFKNSDWRTWQVRTICKIANILSLSIQHNRHTCVCVCLYGYYSMCSIEGCYKALKYLLLIHFMRNYAQWFPCFISRYFKGSMKDTIILYLSWTEVRCSGRAQWLKTEIWSRFKNAMFGGLRWTVDHVIKSLQ